MHDDVTSVASIITAGVTFGFSRMHRAGRSRSSSATCDQTVRRLVRWSFGRSLLIFVRPNEDRWMDARDRAAGKTPGRGAAYRRCGQRSSHLRPRAWHPTGRPRDGNRAGRQPHWGACGGFRRWNCGFSSPRSCLTLAASRTTSEVWSPAAGEASSAAGEGAGDANSEPPREQRSQTGPRKRYSTLLKMVLNWRSGSVVAVATHTADLLVCGRSRVEMPTAEGRVAKCSVILQESVDACLPGASI